MQSFTIFSSSLIDISVDMNGAMNESSGLLGTIKGGHELFFPPYQTEPNEL